MWRTSCKFIVRDPRLSLAAITGIAVAVLIAFVEMGFMNGVIDSHLRIVRAVRGELVVLDAKRDNLTKWDELSAIRLQQIAAIPGVSAVLPVYQAGVGFRSSPDQPYHRIILLAFAPDAPPLDLGWSPTALAALRRPGSVLFDRMSQPIYGELTPGRDVWIDQYRMTLAGFVSLGPNVINDGTIIASESTLKLSAPDATPRMAVIRLSPETDPQRIKNAIHDVTGHQVDAFQPAELAARETAYLRKVAPIGQLFGAGMMAGLFVGMLICYQAVYESVRRRLKAFATLKAMGFSDGSIFWSVMAQSVFLGLGGYLAGLILAWFADGLIAHRTGLAVELTFWRACAIAGGCIAACALAGTAAAVKAVRTDPGSLL